MAEKADGEEREHYVGADADCGIDVGAQLDPLCSPTYGLRSRRDLGVPVFL